MKPILFKNLIDVTKPPYCADNTGKRDCTAILCRVLDDLLIREAEGIAQTAKKILSPDFPTAAPGFGYIGFENRKYIYQGRQEMNIIFPEFVPPSRIIYFPAGTYLVSDTVCYTLDSIKNIFHAKPFYQIARGIHFLGESSEKVTVKLADNSCGFEAGAGKPVISYIRMAREDWRREITNVAQMNTFSGITVDCGKGNPGAIGLLFVSSNSGRIENSNFISEGSECAIQTAVGSEGVANDLKIRGFDYGVRSTDSAPLIWETVSMTDIRKAGMQVGGRTILHHVRCENAPLLQFAPGYGVCFADDANVNRDVETDQNTLFIGENSKVSIYGRRTEIPFGDRVWKMTRKMPPFPKLPDLPDGEWVSVDDFGAIGDGKTECSAAIQKALDSGKAGICFGEGHYLLDRPITVPASARVIDFHFCDLFAGENLKQCKEQGAFVVREDSDGLLTFCNLYTFEQFCGYFRLIEHSAKRPLHCKDLHTQTAAMYFNTVEGSTVWLDNCACTVGTYSQDAILKRIGMEPEYCGVIPFEFHGQTVYARNLNPERADVEVLNDHSTLLVYGLKTEGPGTMLKTINDGISEICVMSAGIGKTDAPNALIVNDRSETKLYGLRIGGFAPHLLFNKIVEESDGKETKSFFRTDIRGQEINENTKTVICYCYRFSNQLLTNGKKKL